MTYAIINIRGIWKLCRSKKCVYTRFLAVLFQWNGKGKKRVFVKTGFGLRLLMGQSENLFLLRLMLFFTETLAFLVTCCCRSTSQWIMTTCEHCLSSLKMWPSLNASSDGCFAFSGMEIFTLSPISKREAVSLPSQLWTIQSDFT